MPTPPTVANSLQPSLWVTASYWSKILALLVMLAIVLPQFVRDVAALSSSMSDVRKAHHLPLYYAAFASSFAALLTVPFISHRLTRWAIVGLAFGSVLLELLALRIANQPFRAAFLELAWRERAVAADTMSGYLPLALPILGVVALCTAAALLQGGARLPMRLVAPIVILAFVTTGLVTHLNPSAGRIPPVFSAWTKSATALFFRTRPYIGPKDPVAYTGTPAPLIDNVVLIVDESVRGDILGINNGWAKTPFLATQGDRMINFGAAASMANCSDLSRFLIRHGIREQELPGWSEDFRRRPTFWQHATRAGFETTHVDAVPAVFGVGHSGMTPAEQKLIGNVLVIDTKPDHDRDQHIARNVMPGLLSLPAPKKFIFVEKFGIHIPYANKIPAHFVKDNGAAEPSNDTTNLESFRATYALAVKWSTDAFLKDLLPRIDLSHSVVIYTSDHGQGLLEGPMKTLHCSTGFKIPAGEALVPMLVFTENPLLQARLRSAAAAATNKTSHFELYPTLLKLFGYDQGWIDKTYGQSLFDTGPRGARRFLSGVRSDELVWNPVD